MYFSPNMSLEIWDLGVDDFDWNVLASNLSLIDQHDHSEGNGKQITGSTGIVTASIQEAQLGAGSVSQTQLQADSVGQPQLQNDSVGAPQLQPGSVTYPAIPVAAITAQLLDPTLIPLGLIAQWWRPPGTNTLPGGFWEIMDGRPWSQITNAWNLTTGSIPDMRGRFSQGADLLAQNGPPLGGTGGSSSVNLAHTHHTLGHYHTFGGHDHSISADGSHYHLWQGGLHMATRTNSLPIGMTVQGAFGGNAQNTFYSMYIQNLLSSPGWLERFSNGTTQQVIDAPADMDTAGGHEHGGSTGWYGGGSTSTTTDSTDNGTLGTVGTVPPYTGLIYIMRVR